MCVCVYVQVLGPDPEAVVSQLSSEIQFRHRKGILDKNENFAVQNVKRHTFTPNHSVESKHTFKVLYVAGSVLSATGEF